MISLTPAEAKEMRRNVLARLIAASKMGLLEDPLGAKLPLDCYGQMLSISDAIFVLLGEQID